MQAVNGKPKVSGDTRDNLDNMTCPEIPVGTTFLAGASAASESQAHHYARELPATRERSVCSEETLEHRIYR